MAVETYEGVHATCADHVESILREGFWLSQDNLFLGEAVYFYANTDTGLKLAREIQRYKAQKKCASEDPGAILHAKIEAEPENIFDFTKEPYLSGLERLKNEFWDECNSKEMPHKEKHKILNRRRCKMLEDFCLATNSNYDLAKIFLPFKSKTALGLAVFNVDCIKAISKLGDAV